MKILRLSLKEAAFDVMVTGEKKWEFREPTQWIKSRLFTKDGTRRKYDYVLFTHGYGDHRPYFICRYKGFGSEEGFFTYSNGLEVDVSRNDFTIYLGEIVEAGNVENSFTKWERFLVVCKQSL